ncbi:hypothetical protein PHET_01862 [Paragonimus heterotremus]|uniref:Major facilitator superfamily (MFS) profile domain-containing protein n=1 Tax=Paragonimus heterotremus TaxID=100268 RepID=A0A8J4WKU9_9TREM|nr:hypothetical protein PHET_01862 [Paragonimus heterotremus]
MRPVGNVRDRYVDRGPAWVSAICTFVIIGMHYGILNCGALYYPGMMEAFDYPISTVSWLVTGQFAVAFCLAPVYNRILDITSHRIGAIFATLLTSAGIFISTFLNNYFMFLVPYTIVGGVGLGMSVVRVLAIMADYFDRYRVLALAMGSSGTGLGTFIFSTLGAYLIDTYTWRVSLMFVALIHLNMIPLTLLMRPVPPEPTPEAEVIIADQPDLSTVNANVVLTAEGKPEVQGLNLFQSMMSIQSRRSIQSCAVEELPRRLLSTHDLQVVIEFVMVTRKDNSQNNFCISQITFLNDPGSVVFGQIEKAARSVMENTQIITNGTLVPIMFIYGEPWLKFSPSEAQKGAGGGDVTELIASRISGVNVSDASQQPQHPAVVGDSFASAMLALRDRKQVRQTVRDVVRKAEKRVQDFAQRLTARGLTVCPSPVVAIIDRSNCSMRTNEMNDYGTGDRVRVLGYCGAEETIIEEVDPNECVVSGPIPRMMDIRKTSCISAESPGLTATSFKSNKTSQIQRTSICSRDRVSFVGSTSFVSKGVRRVTTSISTPQDMTVSILSMNTPKEAIDKIIAKVEAETKGAEPHDAYVERKLPKFLLADPILLAFLLSRTFCFISDSIILAHLSNFALYLDFPPDKAATLLSYLGFTALVGRFSMGFVGQFIQQLDVRSFSSTCMILVSVCILALPFYPTEMIMFAFAIVYGILVCPSFAFAPGMEFQIVGPTRYDEAVSFLFQFEALGFLIGGPLGGVIKEASSRYLDCFIFAGVCDLCSGAILAAIILAGSRRMRQCGLQKFSNELPEIDKEQWNYASPSVSPSSPTNSLPR